MTELFPADSAPAAGATADQPAGPPPGTAGAAYRVLARKYRPNSFATLIGQDALVRTLTNAIHAGRIAQAYMLTGVRGVGKTTSARIIARSLNCIGADGRGGPTVTPCGSCLHCRAITEDRHVDVIEMDAASHTGVDDIREIIDGVRYAPVSARYKVYIIDEVHMLSTKAFNALLKTLEEPPAHVKFVFATTEIRKVPITVLSRCQRFDLRRVDATTLIDHFNRICGLEGVDTEPEAIALIARAADGSVRDGLSLLDQAIALGGQVVRAGPVRDMLGLADRQRSYDLFEAVISAEPAAALSILEDLHRSGADPVQVLRDLLELTHTLTRFKVTPDAARAADTPEAERVRGAALAERLGLPALARLWQMLLKGLTEVQYAPAHEQAVEMVIIRLAYASTLPAPADLIRQLKDAAPEEGRSPRNPPVATGPGGGGTPREEGPAGGPPAPTRASAVPSAGPRLGPGGGRTAPPDSTTATAGATALAPATPLPSDDDTESPRVAVPPDFRALVQLFAERREGTLYGHLYSNVHLVRYAPGQLEFRPRERAMPQLASRVGTLLETWTGRRWIISLSNDAGAPTLSEQDAAAAARTRETAAAHPLVRAILEAFPGSRLATVHEAAPPPAAAIVGSYGAGSVDADDGEDRDGNAGADGGYDEALDPGPYDGVYDM